MSERHGLGTSFKFIVLGSVRRVWMAANVARNNEKPFLSVPEVCCRNTVEIERDSCTYTFGFVSAHSEVG